MAIQPFNNDYNLPGTLLNSEDIEINKTQFLHILIRERQIIIAGCENIITILSYFVLLYIKSYGDSKEARVEEK